MLRYRVNLKREGNRVLASIPDVAGVHTFGTSREQALARAVSAIETMFMGMMADREPVPQPAPVARRPFLELPALTEAKLILYRTMRAANVSKAELSRRLGWHTPQVDRLLDLRHASRLDQLEQAFRALDRHLTVSVNKAA